ncbi:uncharacterized protein LOC114576234, partial [Exaiptasia diaphana]|uniref:Uncharacterized protein n=1 Tax=Exaiptasia diaphana TaxID=2652724 RepID=A0A913YTB7_EXADI
MASSMNAPLFGPSYLCEDDVPGSSLERKEPNRLKNNELKFWLKCRGDSLKGLTTKAQLCKRVNEYLQAGFAHFIVDPDKDFIYTKRKQRRLLQKETQSDAVIDTEVARVPSTDSADSEYNRKPKFPKWLE